MTSRLLPVENKAIYSHHHGWLRGWSWMGCREQASELADDTFLRLLTRTEPWERLDEPRAVLTTVAKRVLSNR